MIMINGNNSYAQSIGTTMQNPDGIFLKEPVSNIYTAQDEGKVVSDGALVAQTAYPTEITENDTYDTTNYNSITVNVSDGGGISAVAICTFDIVSGSFALEGDSGIIEDSAFESCSSLTSVTIPNSVTSIGESAFYECQALGTVTFESNSSLETIGESAFYKCHALSSITIPNSVTEIWEDVFADCEALETITFEPTTPPTLSGDLGVPTTCTIRVPQGTLSAYTSAENYPSPDDYTYEEY